MILLLLQACQVPDAGPDGKGDTGSVDSPGDSGPDDTATDLACEDQYDTDIAYEPAEPCDPTLPWVDVSAGVTQTCGVKSDGCAECWGALTAEPEFAVPDVPIQSIRLTAGIQSAATTHICALTLDGRIVCWAGGGIFDENIAPVGTYVTLATGSVFGAAIRDDGSIQQWGREAGCARGPYREVVARDLGLAGLREDGTAEWFFGSEMSSEAFPGTWKQISLGFQWLCGIRTDLDDAVSCVYAGDPLTGDEVNMPDRPEGRFIDVCAGTGEACALDELGTPVCWSVPDGSDDLANPPTGPFVSITCGSLHACALTADGRIECWGADYAGETTPPS